MTNISLVGGLDEVKHYTNIGDGIAVGSGQKYVREIYLKNYQGKDFVTEEDCLKVMKEWLLFAALNDETSGGWIHVHQVRPYRSGEVVYKKHVFQAPLEYYDTFSDFLSTCHFTLWFYTYQEYDKLFHQTIRDTSFATINIKSRSPYSSSEKSLHRLDYAV